MRQMIGYKESLDILEQVSFKNNLSQKLFISNAINRVIATDIKANHNSPEFLTSSMDGYAIKFADQEDQEFIEIIDINPAGSVVQSKVSKGVCIKTFTGSLMPQGADSLIPIENVEVVGSKIKIIKKVPFAFAVRNIGENYKKDEILIKKNSCISFAEIGVLASLNISQIKVRINPIVAIASTGNEILDLGEEQTNNSQIRSSNHLTIEALCKIHGASTLQLGIVKDDINSIAYMLENALRKADIIVTTGGVSVGDYDFVQDVIKDKLKAKVLFHGVNIKPGMHILIALKDEKLIIALPGFAYSSSVCAILYVLPMIYKFRGSDEKLKIVKAKSNENFPKRLNKTIFTACNVTYHDGQYCVNFDKKKQGTSAILTNMLKNPALLIQEENSKDIKSGDFVDIILLN